MCIWPGRELPETQTSQNVIILPIIKETVISIITNIYPYFFPKLLHISILYKKKIKIEISCTYNKHEHAGTVGCQYSPKHRTILKV